MKRNTIVLVALSIMLFACHKDNFQTTPTIKIKDYNASEVFQGQNLVLTIKCEDKEGDVGKSDLTYIRVRTNVIPISNPSINDKSDTVHYTVPTFPKIQSSDFELTIPYNFMDEDPNRNDTMFFKITVRDIEGHQSDTISSKSVVARQN